METDLILFIAFVSFFIGAITSLVVFFILIVIKKIDE